MDQGDGTDEPRITFADLGIQAASPIKDTFLGKVRSFQSLSKKEIAFLVLSLLGVLGVIGITIQRLVVVDKSSADFTFAIIVIINSFVVISFLMLSLLGVRGVIGITIQRLVVVDKSSADFTFAIIVIINSCFCIWYIFDGIFFERPYELGVFALATLVVWIYIILNYAVSEKGPYKMARLIAASVLSPCVIVAGLWLARAYHESKNLIFRTVGASPALQDVCQTMFIFYSLLKADLQVCITTAVLILTSGQHLDTEDCIALPLVIVVGFVSLIAGFTSVRYEIRWVMVCYYVLWITMPAYAIYLIVKSAQDLHSTGDNTIYSEGIVAVTFVAAGALLVVRVVALYYGIKVFVNFGQGLKERVYSGAMEKHFEQGNIQTGNTETPGGVP